MKLLFSHFSGWSCILAACRRSCWSVSLCSLPNLNEAIMTNKSDLWISKDTLLLILGQEVNSLTVILWFRGHSYTFYSISLLVPCTCLLHSLITSALTSRWCLRYPHLNTHIGENDGSLGDGILSFSDSTNNHWGSKDSLVGHNPSPTTLVCHLVGRHSKDISTGSEWGRGCLLTGCSPTSVSVYFTLTPEQAVCLSWLSRIFFPPGFCLTGSYICNMWYYRNKISVH